MNMAGGKTVEEIPVEKLIDAIASDKGKTAFARITELLKELDTAMTHGEKLVERGDNWLTKFENHLNNPLLARMIGKWMDIDVETPLKIAASASAPTEKPKTELHKKVIGEINKMSEEQLTDFIKMVNDASIQAQKQKNLESEEKKNGTA